MNDALASGDTRLVVRNDWASLQPHTPARIGRGRAGISQITAAQLLFQTDHARARDAVHAALDLPVLRQQLQDATGLVAQVVRSAAPDRRVYLQRPDLGRLLRDDDVQRLRDIAAQSPSTDIAILIADGLSSFAVMQHATALLMELLPLLQPVCGRATLCIAEQGRVALGDDVGAALNAKLVIVLIGERPGLSAADSLGIYLTHAPQRGRSDAERNCISNVRPEGMSYADAARTCAYLVHNALKAGYSGVKLKDHSRVLDAAEDSGIPFLR